MVPLRRYAPARGEGKRRHGYRLGYAVCTSLGDETCGVPLEASYRPHYLMQMTAMFSPGSGPLNARRSKAAPSQHLSVAVAVG